MLLRLGVFSMFLAAAKRPASSKSPAVKAREKAYRNIWFPAKAAKNAGKRLEKLEDLQRALKDAPDLSVDTIGDIAYMMDNKKKLKKIRVTVLAVGIPLEIAEWVSFFYGLNTGIWWPFMLGLSAVIAGSIWISWYYYKNVKYICPKCHEVFKPKFCKLFWANHTPNTRKLTCTACGHKGFCVEVYGGKDA